MISWLLSRRRIYAIIALCIISIVSFDVYYFIRVKRNVYLMLASMNDGMDFVMSGMNSNKTKQNNQSLSSGKNYTLVNRTKKGPSKSSSSSLTKTKTSRTTKKRRLRRMKWLKSRVILSRRPNLNSLHEWLLYHHYLVYPYGIPLKKGDVHFVEDDVGYVYEGFLYEPPNITRWESHHHLRDRRSRFPSVAERIRFYMGRWYPTTNSSTYGQLFDEEFRQRMKDQRDISSNEKLDRVFMEPLLNPFSLSPTKLFQFIKEPTENNKKKRLVQLYTRDIIDLAILRSQPRHNNASSTPILIKFGDGSPPATSLVNRSYPAFGKVRDLIAESDQRGQRCGQQPEPDARQCGEMLSTIIWPMNRARHFKYAAKVPRLDIEFEKKKEMLVWRGRCDLDLGMVDVLPIELSSMKQRLTLVENHLNSNMINAKCTNITTSTSTPTFHSIPHSYLAPKLQMKDMLQYKYLLSIEGNDVSSGLKWMLFSNSLVFLPPITYASWSMEPFLEPFVHYVPVHANMSNVEEMVAWAKSHPAESQRIAERGTLFVYDLLFHQHAFLEEEYILTRIMELYEDIFGLNDVLLR